MLKTRQKRKNGFTMAEMLIAVAIVLILFAIAIPSVIIIRRNLRQQELDSKAQTIYIAAQNQFVKLRSSGNADGYTTANDNAAKVYPLINEPSDRAVEIDETGEAVAMPRLYFISSEDLPVEGSAASLVMKEMTADSELTNNAWIIEFIPESGSVYAVFYSEKTDLSDYYSNWAHYDELRYKDNRLSDGARVGYYGGDSVGTSSTAVLEPIISIINAETLTATFQCTRPSISPVGENLTFHIVLSDNEGHSYAMDYTYGGARQLERNGRSYYATITFDDLSSEATRFNKLFGLESGHGSSCLVPGTELTVSLTVRSPNKLIEPRTVIAVTNSLFANDSNSFTDSGSHNNTAVIEYGRHLQNLDVLYDENVGGYNNPNVVNAVQAKTVSFRESMSSNDWAALYCGEDNTYFNGRDSEGKAYFKPITVGSNFRVFDGRNNENTGNLLGLQIDTAENNCTIEGLNISTSGDAGLFSEISGNDSIELKNISLSGATVKGTGTAGALVGTVSDANVEVENCRVYLNSREGDLRDKTHKDNRISGRTAGGLIGVISADSVVEFTDSFASSVIRGSVVAGGLVGTGRGDIYVSTSYADSYLYGSEIGGLIGSTTVDADIRLTDCYSAGFLYSTGSAAGLVNGPIDGMTRCYTICAMNDEEKTYYSTVFSVPESRVNSVYFFKPDSSEELKIGGTADISGRTATELYALLNGPDGNKFTVDTSSSTHPYNLMGQTLTTYTYPRLTANDHYGDWEADFQVGSLIYYEKYNINGLESYGFHGGNVTSTLTNDGTIVGDGYGVVYRAGDPRPDTVNVEINGTSYVLDLTGDHHNVHGKDGIEYHVYPFPTQLVNAENPAGNFYQKVVIGASEESDETARTYFYNPYFAKTVKSVYNGFDENLLLSENEQISVRSARHLYDLSLYHDVYADELDGREITFLQERNISYSAYDWNGFYKAGVSRIDSQEPIGKGAKHFKSNYNGQCFYIDDISFISQSGNYVGLFGYNEGDLQNIVVKTAYIVDAAHHYLVQRKDDIGMNSRVSMGVIAGYNGASGVVNNCAAAGYYIAGYDGTIHAYSNSLLYVGGLVGTNEGHIQNSASDCPTIRLSTLEAEAYVGGFVGSNQGGGVVYNCYALGHLNVAYSRGGSVSLAGFAGQNKGSISNSYCAVSLVSSGETSITYAFSPKGGAMSGNYYLDRGTYTYINTLHSYTSDPERTAGVSKTRKELIELRGRARVDSAHSFDYPNTKSADQAYPYRGIVRDHYGAYVHYGDWQDDAVLGTLGVFYWEHEEYGANDGYHLTYIGTDEGLSDVGTTLCTEHDDGGVITEFGYGYYVKEGEEDQVTAELENIIWSGKDKVNLAAQTDLHIQMQDYVFYPFTTKITAEGDYICLNGGPNDRDGKITLTFHGADSPVDYEYTVSPFFANAIRSSKSGRLASSDGTVTDYKVIPGNTANPYEVRSVSQLQFINWNAVTCNCSTLVYGKTGVANSGNYKHFPYLQYATVINTGVQSREAVEALRPPQNWLQTHDLSGSEDDVVTPIAGMATSSPVSNGSYVNILFAWFGGSYDGQSYKIQNVDVVSEAYTVGLFGVVAGANIKNVILYSSTGENKIQRYTQGRKLTVSGTEIDFERAPGAYSVGGLVGIAYEYKSTSITNKIENCAIAGYQVIDSSTNQQGAGTANVGGLIGLANINLERCSSVASIIIDCTHDYGHMAWGSYFRIGGLAGSAGAPGASVSVRDCYTGGSITVTERCLNEVPSAYDGNGFALRDKGGTGHSSNLFISGMIGGSYAPNISNFTSQTSNSPDGTAYIDNCYTYLQLPDLEGTIRAVSLFASPADRYARDTRIYITNSYYLESVAENVKHPDRSDPSTWPKYFFAASKGQGGVNKAPTEAEWARMLDPENPDAALIEKFSNLVISEEEFQEMLGGKLNCLRKYLNNQGNDSVVNLDPTAAKGFTFAQLSDQSQTETSMAKILNAGSGKNWGWVTVTEGNGAQINGKYSFSSNSAQEGKNYPFPTVITQKGLTYSEIVNVHYGEWPIDGLYWKKGLANMNIFDDMQPENEDGERWAEKVFTLVDSKRELEEVELDTDSFAVSPSGIVEIIKVERDEENPKNIHITLRALKDGAATVSEIVSGTGASFVVSVTADLDLRSEPEIVENYINKTSDLALKAVSHKGQDFSGEGEWTYTDSTFVNIESGGDLPNIFKITHDEPCSMNFETRFTYEYNGTFYVFNGFVPVKTFGYLGLATIPNAEGKSEYSAAARQQSGSVLGKSMTYSADAPALPDNTDGELYLYESITDSAISRTFIELMTVSFTDENGEQRYEYTFDEDGRSTLVSGTSSENKFDITLGDSSGFVADLNYAYMPISFRYVGTGVAPSVKINATVIHYEDFTETEDGEKIYTRYSFNVSMRSHNYMAIFLPNGGTGHTPSIRTPDGNIVLPECGFRRTGYDFAGWEYTEGGETIVLLPGDTCTITDNVTFTALWTPYTYTVLFDPDFETDQTMEPMSFTYDEAQALSESTFVREGYSFIGWATEPGGKVVYEDMEAVSNLTSKKDGTVTLYAVWGEIRTLTLNENYEGAPSTGYTTLRGVTTALEGYETPERTGYVLLGWFTAPDGGIRVLDENGNIISTIHGYTGNMVFDLTEDRTLYAHWSKLPVLTLDSNIEGAQPERQQFFIFDEMSSLEGYTTPTFSNVALIGWFTEAEGGTMVLNADGSVAAELEGYTADGLFKLTEDKTLYAHWNVVESVFLIANEETREYANTDFGIYNGPESFYYPWREGRQLEGWYAIDDEGNYVKVLRDYGALVASDVEGFVENGVLKPGITLYAKWVGVKEVIRENYIPNGQSWSDSTLVNWDAGEYVEVMMKLNNKGNASGYLKQNVLSFALSEENLIDSAFSGGRSTFHMTYPRQGNPNVLRITEMNSKNVFDTPYSNDTFVMVRLTNKGLFLSDPNDLGSGAVIEAFGTSSENAYKRYKQIIAAMTTGENTLWIGSMQGGTRSFANDYLIRVMSPVIYG